ncbi:MAG: hypothetical protein LUD46_23540 [Parabacteroides sp.]|nr:hypothetical protein [Parabacteroides sp.]
MKRLIIVVLLIADSLVAQAQKLTFEYNAGFGSYGMSGMKDLLGSVQPGLNQVKTIDNFPGYLTHDMRIGFEWKRHQWGYLFDYMNTAGKKGVSDYSGDYSLAMRIKGYKIGLFYRYTLADTPVGKLRLQPYLEMSSGTILNNVKMKESLHFNVSGTPTPEYTPGTEEELKFTGPNFFLAPAIGARLKLCSYAAINLSIGYEWDALKSLYLDGDKDKKLTQKADWSGFRVQGGLIFYFPLGKNNYK